MFSTPATVTLSSPSKGPRLGREVLKTTHHRVDLALQRLGKQWMKAWRDGRCELGAGFDHGLVACRPLDNAAVDLDAVGLKDRPGVRPGRSVEPGFGQRNGHTFGLGRQAQ